MRKAKEQGITIITLVVTIVIIVILAGISVNTLVGDKGIIKQAQKDKEGIISEKDKVSDRLNELYAELEIEEGSINEGTFSDKDDRIEELLKEIEELKKQIEELTQGVDLGKIANGNWNGTLNTPKLKDTGLTAVSWINTEWVELTEESSEADWAKWYDYEKKWWANAKSKDGSMWVWIPRFEYKLDSSKKTITVRFISTDIKKGTEGYTTDETGITTSSDGYIIHPAFTADINNGGWDSELTGFWIAKYSAGFQNSTAGEDVKTVEYSPTLRYTTVNSTYTSNFLETKIVKNETKLSYPVFKADTYVYNIISIADAWLLSQEIDSASMYGLKNVDSHMQKNSEWGAVAYLTHSQYGVNGNSSAMNEIAMNNKNLNNTIYVNNATSGTKGNVYAVTSYGSNNTANDVTASSTKNMSGVFDLRGCIWERAAGYHKGGASSTPAYHNAMASSSTTESTKYLTLYTANNKKGDAIKETSGWNGDDDGFSSTSNPILSRGGRWSNTSGAAGIFGYYFSPGTPDNGNGFRVCLAY